MSIQGKVFKYRDNVNTDEIIPARYLNSSDAKELARHCMEDIDAEFVKTVKPGDIIVAGANFGCGSSREHAPVAIKAAGVALVIAESYARIFYRNAINIGLPIMVAPGIVNAVKTGDTVKIDLSTGEIINLAGNIKIQAQPFPEFMTKIINSGGLMGYVKNALTKPA
ncbi:MAG: 3-isopropylmalate dehydratase small subunit [Elusimicrobiota bacterium]